jgi:alpha-ribazole phosphatase
MDIENTTDHTLAGNSAKFEYAETAQEVHIPSASIEPKLRRLWLIRHGVTIWNIERRYFGQYDIALSELGRAQACWLGDQLRSRQIAAIYASDLSRAHETAEIITRSLTMALPIQISEVWRELNFGAWEGLTYAEIAAQYSHELSFFHDPVHQAPPQGETFMALVQRVQSAFRQLAHDAVHLPDGDIVLVSHGGVIRALLCSILSIPFERQWQLQIAHGSFSALDFLAGTDDVLATTTLATLNQHAVQCIQ